MAKRTRSNFFATWPHPRMLAFLFLVQLCLQNKISADTSEAERGLGKVHVGEQLGQTSDISGAIVGRIPNTMFESVMRIVGGKRAPVGKYPYMVALFQENESDPSKLVYRCGGTLLAPNVVLSAAHCGEKVQYAHVGKRHMYDPTEKYESFEIVEQKIHPEYDQKSFRYDFALFRLDGSSSFPTIKIHSEDHPYRNMSIPGTPFTVLGWGKDGSSGENTVTLHEAGVKLWDLDSCITNYGGDRFGDFTMCASEAGLRDSCQGDSGGPLLYRDYNHTMVQVGLVSWGRDCGLAPYPGVYARISAAFTWINDSLCTLNFEYCNNIAAPFPTEPPPVEPPKNDDDDSEGGDGLSPECVDAIGDFVVEDERKRKRFVRSCKWVMERREKECLNYKARCPQTCNHITECPSGAESLQ